jgi:hypothetical protein
MAKSISAFGVSAALLLTCPWPWGAWNPMQNSPTQRFKRRIFPERKTGKWGMDFFGFEREFFCSNIEWDGSKFDS